MTKHKPGRNISTSTSVGLGVKPKGKREVISATSRKHGADNKQHKEDFNGLLVDAISPSSNR